MANNPNNTPQDHENLPQPPQLLTRPKTDHRGGGAVSPLPTDILCGRGRSRHSGNVAFRAVVRCRRARYASLGVLEKSKLVRGIVEAVSSLDPPGRFLERGEDGAWRSVGERRAMEKTRKALQEQERRNGGFASGREPDGAAEASVAEQFERTVSMVTGGEYTDSLPVEAASFETSGMPSAHRAETTATRGGSEGRGERRRNAAAGAMAPTVPAASTNAPKRPAECSPAEGEVPAKKRAGRDALRPEPEADAGDDVAGREGGDRTRRESDPPATDGDDDSGGRRPSLWLPLSDSEVRALVEDVAAVPTGRGGVLGGTDCLGEAALVCPPSGGTKMRRRSSVFSLLWFHPIERSGGLVPDEEAPALGVQRRRSSIFGLLRSPRADPSEGAEP